MRQGHEEARGVDLVLKGARRAGAKIVVIEARLPKSECLPWRHHQNARISCGPKTKFCGTLDGLGLEHERLPPHSINWITHRQSAVAALQKHCHALCVVR